MATAQIVTDDLLDPISPDQPAGSDLRWTADWDRIKEARRADDNLDTGKWTKKERKSADWRLTRELAAAMLRKRSKDLQLALWLTEANIKLDGFPGLRDGLRITRELMVRYWDKGLYPVIEDGPEDRVGPFEWLSNKLVDAIMAIPITVRGDGGTDYSFVDWQDAFRVGSEANWKTPDGEIDGTKKKAYEQALADGHVSMEMFERAIQETKRADYEELNSDFLQTYDEFKALEKIIDEKFGDMAPNLSTCRTALSEMKQAIADILDKKRSAEPDPLPVGNVLSRVGPSEETQHRAAAAPAAPRLSLPQGSLRESPVSAGDSWLNAETLIRSGQVEKGLAEMTRLAASETNGRNRFQRKLLLAEVCLGSKRERLARPILEELAEQIDKFQLELWESSELIGSVWTKLYRLYKLGAESSDLDRADKLYERLCRLDPWQALSCTEG
jgi:type VI secretion system protein ImpA